MATLKKSAGYGTPTKRGQLRSPTIKRPLSAPVTMQGWLHKQGSDGLMLWKKRWFVLSEYCLFYYKGPEEEKLLGSILLPSYRISPCSSEDRVYRKFSFKAEHANMRTYYFAADSHQSMSQWMNALSLASILQESNSWEEHRSGASTGSSHRNPSTEDSDSGFHGGGTTLRQPISNQTNISGGSNNENTGCTTPSNNNWNNNSNNNQLTVGGYQPLYANAPPKPRRLNNDSSSTERSPERNNSEDCSSGGGGRLSRMIVQQPQDYNVRNERPYYYNAQHSQHSHHPPPPQLIIHPNNTLINNVQYCNNSCNNERRTPDTYGRSNTATPCNSIAQQQKCGKIIQSKLKNSDYEDIYQNNPDIIIQHQNNHHNIINTNTIPYTNQEIQYRRRRVDDHHLTVNSMNEKQRRFPPRPHSADFLEYDNRRYYNSPTPQSSSGNSSNHMFLSNNHHEQHNLVAGGNNTGNVISQHQQPQSQQPRRPKSSLDILHHGNFDGNLINSIDSYGYNYWSEESYARKMRQSSSYINPNNFQTNQNVSNSSRATTPSLRQQQLPTLPLMKTTQNITYDPCNSTNNANNEPAPNSVTMRNQSEFIQQQERRWSEYVESRNNMLSNSCSNNQFTRSASARLPRQHIIDDDDVSDRSYRQSYKRRNSSESSKDGTNKSQQREESMKRLLEWKQRMLQSPLTRKNSCSSTRGIAQNELNYYKQQVLRDLSNCDTTPVGTQHLAQSSIINQLKTSQTWDRLSSTTPDNEPWNSNTMPEFRPSRKKHSDDHNIRSSSGRSRSQDGRRSASILNQSRYTSYSSDDEASGSGSVIGRDPLPPRVNNAPTVVDKPPPLSPSPLYVPPPGPILRQPDPDLSHKRVDGPGQWNLHMSAGELLGRTHEELVLLLIQLRRQSAGFCKAMEACHMEIEAQARLAELETPKRLEHLQKLEDLKRHLLDLEKQYEKGKPLVNLVDNMVKLGSLCRVGAPFTGQNGAAHGLNGSSPLLRERLEFNHKVQEQRLLAEERRDWQRLSPDHNQLQAKVAQLYRLDRLLQEESGTLYSLQQDKEMLERALGGLRHKLQGIHGNPAEAERYRRQQRLLERELTRVRSILAHNSKKLEETVAENARLEQELVILRQKLQTSRRVPDSSTGPTTAALEAELRRVQTLVGDLQRQRQELSLQVRQLTEKSHSLSQQIRPGPTGIAGAGPILGKKRAASSWLETDLDSQVTRDLGLESPPTTTPCGRHSASPIPLYVNTEDSKSVSPTNISSTNSETPSREDVPPPPPPQPQYCRPININEADDRVKRFYGIIPKDKPQEIKTVRIVKRESERRQRDRDRSGNIGIPITNSATNPKRINVNDDSGTSSDSNERSMLSRVMEEPSESPPPAPGRSDSVNVIKNIVSRQAKMKMDGDKSSLSAHEQLFGSVASLVSSEGGSPQLSPVYQSEAARQIVEEMAAASKVGGRRLVPREKRRHHTVSSGRPVLRIDTSYSAGGSRDDLDMERALRPRLNAPDVVRSTLSRVDTKFSSETIDNLLGTPGKILIPERYIPESTPELSMEEQERRLKKADAIRKMLSETTVTASDATGEENDDTEDEKSSTLKKKVAEEKRQREHLLQLSQIIAQQVMEKSKIVAVKALENLPLELKKKEEEDAENDEDLSPADPLPLYQQRDQFYS